MNELRIFLNEWELKTRDYFMRVIEEGKKVNTLEYWNSHRQAYEFKNNTVARDKEGNIILKGKEGMFFNLIMDIKKEREKKETQLIKKVESKVGTIIDARALKIGKDGNLNGIVEGENGKVRVTTIYAAGEIQRPHFRTLVKAIK